MARKKNILRFIASAKICSSHLAYKYVMNTNYGKDTSKEMDVLILLRSYIRTLESCAGIPRRTFRGIECETICVKTCLSKQEICIIANKIKSICKTC